NQGPDYHREGFSTMIGKFKKSKNQDGTTTLDFASGIVVRGKLGEAIKKDGKTVILPFSDCIVTFGKEILFKPEWGTFDLACGERVVSVFGGAADREKYVAKTGGFKQQPMPPKCNLTEENRRLNELYALIRELRENKAKNANLATDLATIEEELEKDYSTDWL